MQERATALEAPALPARPPAVDDALVLQDQLSRDARTRVVAAGTVVLVHSAYPPGHPALAALPSGVQDALATVTSVLSSFPVNTFVLLSFLSLAPRLANGVPPRRLLRTVLLRLGAVQVFWAGTYLAARAALEQRLPTPRAVLEGVVLGTAADHLYFVPVLLALTAAAPLLARAARTDRAALGSAVACAAASVTLHRLAGPGADAWTRAAAGVVGFAPFAIAGLAFSRKWGGSAPGRRRAAQAAPVALAATLASVALLAISRGRADRWIMAWAGVNGCAIGIPVLLLSFGGRASPRLVRLAGATMGVYFVHALFAQVLRRGEAALHALDGLAPALIAPNAILTAALSVAAVTALGRTRLRRVVR